MNLVYIVFGLTIADLPAHTSRILAVYKTEELAKVAAEKFEKDSFWSKIEVQPWRVLADTEGIE